MKIFLSVLLGPWGHGIFPPKLLFHPKNPVFSHSPRFQYFNILQKSSPRLVFTMFACAGDDPLVQPCVAARAAVPHPLHPRPGAVPGQRHSVPQEELSHCHPHVSPALSLETHIQVSHSLRDQARHRSVYSRSCDCLYQCQHFL